MEEKADGSSKRRRPHSSTKIDDRSVIPDWASLLPELVQGIADCVLSTTGGVDAYMYMRGVCPSWRKAITMPSPLAAVADFRFRPRHWIMLDLKPENPDDDTRLFLHATTGRFGSLPLPVLRDHILVGATDGLLVIRDRDAPHLTRVLNPFTGDMLHFSAPLPEDFGSFESTAVNGGSHSTLVLLHEGGCVIFATPTSDIFTDMDFEEDNATFLNFMVSFQGNIYCACEFGRVFEFIAPAELVVVAEVSSEVDVYTVGADSIMRSYLVDSAGELLLVRLLVRYADRSFKVFRVNVEHKLLEEVKSLGGRALFLGDRRCVSVEADKLPSVDGDCIYIIDFAGHRDMCVYNLMDDRMDFISSKNYRDQPFSLAQVLLQSCY